MPTVYNVRLRADHKLALNLQVARPARQISRGNDLFCESLHKQGGYRGIL